ncbi:MAG: formylglycine-generating enzyme family protein [Planctomycetota bacterium]
MNPKRLTLILAALGAITAVAVIISQLNSIPQIEGFRYTGRGAGGALEYTHEATELEFVFLKGGEFLMGSPESEAGRQNSETQHRVTLSPFLIAKYEVKREIFINVMNMSAKQRPPGIPASGVSWDSAKGFCDRTGLELPTEAQWEYACRAGTTTATYAKADTSKSDGGLGEIAWYGVFRGGKVQPVGTKKPNTWGIHDMLGNVMEWCQDWYGDYPKDPVVDPRGPETGVARVTRGGSFNVTADACRSAGRAASTPQFGDTRFGFRPAKSLQER